MSPEALFQARQNYGLRLAAAVTIGLTLEVARGVILPPLAAVIALQLLAMPGPAPKAKVVVALIGVMAGASLLAYAVAVATVDYWILYAIGVGLLYLWSFFLAVRPKTAPLGAMALTMVIVVTALSAASTGVAILLVWELLTSVIVGILLVFFVHTVFPHRGPAMAAQVPQWHSVEVASLRAILATAIILPLHLYMTSSGVAAMVVLITVATMLRQPGLADSTRYGINYAIGNLIGGLLAAFAITLVYARDEFLVFVTVILACSLFMSRRLESAKGHAQVLFPGYVAFALLFGLVFSPLTQGSDVAYLQRVTQIVTAALYALAAISIFIPPAKRWFKQIQKRKRVDAIL
ncbi:MAG: hypothetical protein AAGC81_09550 [Pseudomonadota bacterium]